MFKFSSFHADSNFFVLIFLLDIPTTAVDGSGYASAELLHDRLTVPKLLISQDGHCY